MDIEDISSIYYFVLILLLLLSGFFSGAEVALVSLSPAKARAIILQKRKGAKAIEFLKNNPEKLLITILIGNNLVNIMIPVLATVIFTSLFGSRIIGVLTGILTILILVFGEIVPKTFAQKYAERFSLLSGPLIFWLSKVIFPLVWLLEKLLHVMGSKMEQEKTFSDEELLALAEIGEEEGGLDSEERERIENVLEFGETTAEEIMTPRPKMDILHYDVNLQETIQFFLEKTHSRIPVFRETIDNIVSIISLKNVLHYEQEHPLDTPLGDLPRKEPLFVPMSMALEDVLKNMKRQRTHMAIVVDEHGGTAGLVTLEDLLEEIVGEIQDETDKEQEEIKKISDSTYLVLGDTEIEKIEEEIGWEVPGEDTESIAKVVLDTIGRFPKSGENIEISENILAEIAKMDGHKIESIRLILRPE